MNEGGGIAQRRLRDVETLDELTYTICEDWGYWVVLTHRHGEQGCSVYVCYSLCEALDWCADVAQTLFYLTEAG